jgi:hypothetical protein
MQFLHGDALTDAMLRLVAKDAPTKAAIAYWGKDALKRLNLDPKKPGLEVICCLKGGKSDPDVIRQLGKKVLQIDNLLTLHPTVCRVKSPWHGD